MNAAPELVPIIVTSDGETWAELSGGSICLIAPNDYEKLLGGASVRDLAPVVELMVNDVTTPRGVN